MSDVAGVVKSIRDTMRKDAGISGDAQRIDQMAWILFLKIVSAPRPPLSCTSAMITISLSKCS